MKDIEQLFANNSLWAKNVKLQDPDYFTRLSQQQSPQYLWIGCSDSRVPANQIIDLPPGEVFVHRNIANVVAHSDLNCLSVLQYAIDVLEVKHIIVCGHYGCGGIAAALDDKEYGLIDSWLQNIEDVYRLNREQVDSLGTEEERQNLMCELNVIEQVRNVSLSNIVQNAWARNQTLHIHGWIYGIDNGILKDLGVSTTNPA